MTSISIKEETGTLSPDSPSGGFTDLHTLSYQDVLNGGGFHASQARPSIETVYTIRNATPQGLTGDYHPFLKAKN